MTEPHWIVDRVSPHADGVTETDVRSWLARLAGHGEAWLIDAALPDDEVRRWRAYGTAALDRRVLTLAAPCRRQNSGLPLPNQIAGASLDGLPSSRIATCLQRSISVAGRPDIAAQFAQLRATGVRRIAVFTEDATASPRSR